MPLASSSFAPGLRPLGDLRITLRERPSMKGFWLAASSYAFIAALSAMICSSC
jgi:hypothetical protein